MKDNDFREGFFLSNFIYAVSMCNFTKGLHVSRAVSDKILRQLEIDSKFLSTLNIMDYSLLLVKESFQKIIYQLKSIFHLGNSLYYI